MEDSTELQHALCDSMHRLILDDHEKCRSEYKAGSYMGSNLSDHMFLVSYLSDLESCSKINESKIEKENDIKLSKEMLVALYILGN